MHLDQTLIDAAIELLKRRFPAALYTDDGTILTSVVFQPEWGAGGLCAETGAIYEAFKPINILGEYVQGQVTDRHFIIGFPQILFAEVLRLKETEY